MDSLFDVQVEGLTAFASPRTAKFRYVISLKGAKVNICLRSAQGRNSGGAELKRQLLMSCSNRQTGYLNKKNYATAANIFVDASAAEYVWVSLADRRKISMPSRSDIRVLF
ncbi:hypothetical protein JG688_00014229 [Phytophthora aleatoria]|uniref:Uncharacterized protein n=1 Tax=Phytophthora aleatoria TaxID=2496075 RepID=A0A8J5MDJ7_9STRA|nr:hypothetical protein JG688_00014229 [Phytophthora aleatoria]